VEGPEILYRYRPAIEFEVKRALGSQESALADMLRYQPPGDTARDRLEKRLAELEPRIKKSSDPEDLQAISFQQREAFYRCE